ncbi:hypothetical protein [Yeosuana sp.]|uniref:hypothetical protein n=1 Tax=Yeosuana sp. TaxID=2529388 RepID=UPI00405533CE|tara:strand:- start:906 stop:1103 length:198 start_codon:yes stop_codon:yes gene_type:complete
MPEVTYSILDFTGAIPEKSFQEITKELDSKGFDLDNTLLSQEQLKVFLCKKRLKRTTKNGNFRAT